MIPVTRWQDALRSGDLAGRCVLVLGAGEDPGASAACQLAAAGAQVVAADKDYGRLRDRLGGQPRIALRTADPREPSEMSALIEELTALDVVVWAAAKSEDAGGVVPVTAMEVANCWSVFDQFASAMEERGGGSLIALSAMPARHHAMSGRTGPWRALCEVVRDCAVNLESRGVRVNAVMLGEGHGAGALIFLASEESWWLTGSAVAVKSGWSQIERLVPASVPA